jgi:hypothetical protein
MSNTCQIKNLYALLNEDGALNRIQWFENALYRLSYDFYKPLYSKYFHEITENEEEKLPLPQDPELIASTEFINIQDARKKTINKIETIEPEKIIASNSDQAQNTYNMIMKIGRQQEINRKLIENIPWWKFKIKKEKNRELVEDELQSIELSNVLGFLAYYFCENKQLGSIDNFNKLNRDIAKLRLKNMG